VRLRHGARHPVRLAPLALAAAAILAVGLALAAPSAPALVPGPVALAADPSPIAPASSQLPAASSTVPTDPYATPAAVGDPRSSGEGAGLVGAPLFALGGMLLVGLVAAAGTLLYVRLTGGSRPG
jgi:hypothetical protein